MKKKGGLKKEKRAHGGAPPRDWIKFFFYMRFVKRNRNEIEAPKK